MRDRLFSHILSMSGNFFRKNTTGDLMARATNDISTIRQATGKGFVSYRWYFYDRYDYSRNVYEQFSGCCLDNTSLPLITAWFCSWSNSRQTVQENSGYLVDTCRISPRILSWIRIVKSFVKEDYFFEKISIWIQNIKMQLRDLVKTSASFSFITFLSGLSTVLLILLVVGLQFE